jgi:hypothetical protein
MTPDNTCKKEGCSRPLYDACTGYCKLHNDHLWYYDRAEYMRLHEGK